MEFSHTLEQFNSKHNKLMYANSFENILIILKVENLSKTT